jgi:hypothetical protein
MNRGGDEVYKPCLLDVLRIVAPIMPKPTIVSSQVVGSGTATSTPNKPWRSSPGPAVK